MKKGLMLILSICAVLYLGACLYLYAMQRTLLYFPTPAVAADAESISLKSGGETLRIWHLPNSAAEEERAVIYFGGNAEDVAQDLPFFKTVLPAQSVYAMNYRGYGGSTGTPSEDGLFQDATALYDFVKATHKHVSVIGRSLGSGVAVYLATVRDIDKLVLATPYDSVENVAQKQFPYFPIGLLLKDKFSSNRRAGSIKVPTLVLLAEYDELVPRANSEALIAVFPQSIVKVAVIPGSTHNNIGSVDQYWQRLHEFL